jgi:hypothetical protein
MSAEIIVTKTVQTFIPYLPGKGQFGALHVDKAIKLLQNYGGNLLSCVCGMNGCCRCMWFADSNCESMAFTPLKGIFDILAKAWFGGSHPVIKYALMLHHNTKGNISGRMYKIDNYFFCTEFHVPKEGDPNTADIVSNVEYKCNCTHGDIAQLSQTTGLLSSLLC